jgi:phospholipid/cholesterol/gamma-HCH transport system ATP-binding protein
MNVFENSILGMYEHGVKDEKQLEKEAIRVLSAVQLLPEINDVGENVFNKEWQILKYKKPSDLSGGMRKRVGVARALVGMPKYIFYDEPTTGLDPVTSEQIDDLIAELSMRMKVTSVVITHDIFSVFRIAKTVAMLHEGKLRYFGDVLGLRNSQDEIVQEFIDRFVRN